MWQAIVTIGAGLYNAYKQASSTKEYAEDQAEADRKAAEANAAISRYDAEVALKLKEASQYKTTVALANQSNKIMELLGSQKFAYADNGISVGVGTPAQTLDRTRELGKRDAEIILYNGKRASDEYQSLHDRYLMLADKGLRDAAAAANLALEAASNSVDTIYANTAATTANQINTLGKEEGWWS